MATVQIGTRVMVRRINQEDRTGTLLGRVEHLQHIGDYFYVGDPEDQDRRRGRPKKAEQNKINGLVWGMYELRQMKILDESSRTGQ